MAIGTTLVTLRTMLRAEIGQSMDVSASTADDSRHNQLLDSKQKWFADSHDWPNLEDRWDLAVPVQGTPFYAVPTTNIQGVVGRTINFEKEVKAEVLFAQRYLPVGWGIGAEEYNTWNSWLIPPRKADPVRKLRIQDGYTSLEVWPMPVTQQTVRLTGQRIPSALSSDSDPCSLDDLLIVFSVAADILASLEHPLAQSKGALAQARLLHIRAGLPNRSDKLVLGKNGTLNRSSYRRIVPIAVAP